MKETIHANILAGKTSDLPCDERPYMDTPSEKAFRDLLESVRATLETYSNVHRGSRHYSLTTTRIFERARDIVLEYLGLKKRKFCTAMKQKRCRGNRSWKNSGRL